MLKKIFSVVVEAGMLGIDAAGAVGKAGKKVAVSSARSLVYAAGAAAEAVQVVLDRGENRNVEDRDSGDVDVNIPADSGEEAAVEVAQDNIQPPLGAVSTEAVSVDTEGVTAAAVELPIRKKAPHLTLIAAGSKRKVTLDAIGKPAVLLFHGKDNSRAAEALNSLLQEKYYPQSPLFVADILDLQGVPSMFTGYARSELEKTYRRMVKRYARDNVPARDIIFILPDWDGSVAAAFGLSGVTEQLGVVVLDRQGGIAGSYQGKAPQDAVLSLLEGGVG